jgi:hypothetical protein
VRLCELREERQFNTKATARVRLGRPAAGQRRRVVPGGDKELFGESVVTQPWADARLLKLARGRPPFLGVRQRCGIHGSDYLHQCRPDANSSMTHLLVRRDVGGVWQSGHSP